VRRYKNISFFLFFCSKKQKKVKEDYLRSPHPNPLQQERALELRFIAE